MKGTGWFKTGWDTCFARMLNFPLAVLQILIAFLVEFLMHAFTFCFEFDKKNSFTIRMIDKECETRIIDGCFNGEEDVEDEYWPPAKLSPAPPLQAPPLQAPPLRLAKLYEQI